MTGFWHGARRWKLPLVPIVAWGCYLFLLIPTLIIVPVSFGNPGQIEFPPRQLSLGLYRQFFADQSWWHSLLESLLVAALTTVATICLAVPATYAIARSRLPGRRLLRGLLTMPMLVPVVVLGLGLYLQFSRWGLLDTTLGLTLAHMMIATPFVVVAITAGLDQTDEALEKVALVMGASRATIFFRVLLPQLKAAVAVSALFAFLTSLDEVVVAYFITGKDTMTLPVKMYSAIRWELSPVIAAVSSLLTVLSLVISLSVAALQRRQDRTR